MGCRLPLKRGRKQLPGKDGGSVDANSDLSCNHPCCSVQVQFSGPDCGAGGGGLSANSLEKR